MGNFKNEFFFNWFHYNHLLFQLKSFHCWQKVTYMGTGANARNGYPEKQTTA